MSKEALASVAALVARESGIELREARHTSLRAAIRRTGCADPEQLLERIAAPGGRALVRALIDEVTVQETSLYRDAEQFEEIDWPALVAAAGAAGRSTVRIWSAGCATGEEAYTLAMLAGSELGCDTPPVHVVGSDISEAALERARVGRYRSRRLQAVPAEARRRHLAEEDGAVLVRPGLRALVTFVRHNLVSDAAPPPGEGLFDLVVCRNVLIYFDPATAEQVAAKLREAVGPGGQLLLGVADQLGRARGGDAPDAPRGVGGAAIGTVVAPAAPTAEPPAELLARAVAAADAGRSADALAAVEALLVHDPLNAGAHFLRGLVELAADPAAAAGSLRRALLIDPHFGLAAFQLGRAYDALGDADAALAAYATALHTLDPDDARYDELLRQVDLGDIATAIRVRIQGLR